MFCAGRPSRGAVLWYAVLDWLSCLTCCSGCMRGHVPCWIHLHEQQLGRRCQLHVSDRSPAQRRKMLFVRLSFQYVSFIHSSDPDLCPSDAACPRHANCTFNGTDFACECDAGFESVMGTCTPGLPVTLLDVLTAVCSCHIDSADSNIHSHHNTTRCSIRRPHYSHHRRDCGWHWRRGADRRRARCHPPMPTPSACTQPRTDHGAIRAERGRPGD